MSSKTYRVRDADGQAKGPFTDAHVRALIAEGQLGLGCEIGPGKGTKFVPIEKHGTFRGDLEKVIEREELVTAVVARLRTELGDLVAAELRRARGVDPGPSWVGVDVDEAIAEVGAASSPIPEHSVSIDIDDALEPAEPAEPAEAQLEPTAELIVDPSKTKPESPPTVTGVWVDLSEDLPVVHQVAVEAELEPAWGALARNTYHDAIERFHVHQAVADARVGKAYARFMLAVDSNQKHKELQVVQELVKTEELGIRAHLYAARMHMKLYRMDAARELLKLAIDCQAESPALAKAQDEARRLLQRLDAHSQHDQALRASNASPRGPTEIARIAAVVLVAIVGLLAVGRLLIDLLGA